MKKNVFVVIAHPDDECIWMGGMLLRNKNWNTTIVCLCRESDADRHPKFFRACEKFQAKGFIFDLDDEILDPLMMQDYFSILKKFAGSYDLVFTHGKNGEYGHIRHLEVHEAVCSLLDQGVLNSKEVYFFSYQKQENDYQGFCLYDSNADKLIRLSSIELIKKKKIIEHVYGYQKGGFEELSCGAIESFNHIQ